MKVYLIIFFTLLSSAYAGIFNSLNKYREQNYFTDITLVSNENEKFPCHKLLLMAFSEYFEKMFNNGMQESFDDKICLELSSKTIKLILDFIYNNKRERGFSLDVDLYLELFEFANCCLNDEFINDIKKIKINIKIEDIVLDCIFDPKYEKILEEMSECMRCYRLIYSLKPKRHYLYYMPNSNLENIFFSIEGNLIAMVFFADSKEYFVKIFDVVSETVKLELVYNENITSAKFSDDGTKVIISSTDNKIKIWNIFSGELISTFQSEARILEICINKDQSQILIVCSDGTVRILETNDFKQISVLNVPHNQIVNVKYNHDETLVMTVSKDKTTKIWDLFSNRCVLTLDGVSSALKSVSFSPRGNTILTISNDGIAQIWNINNGELVNTFNDPKNVVIAGNFTPNGPFVLTTFQDGYFKIINALNGELIIVIDSIVCNFDPRDPCLDFFSHDGSRIIIQSKKGIIIFELPPYELVNNNILLNSDQALNWLKLKYQLANYFNQATSYNYQPSYEKFLATFNNEDLNKFLEHLNKTNKLWTNYLRKNFKDFSLNNEK